MNRYQPSPFRPAFGVAAFALTALTLVVSVVVPASISSASQVEPTSVPLMCEKAATEVAIRPATIDVTASSNRTVVLQPVNVVARSRKDAA